jgi:hypothetical protein
LPLAVLAAAVLAFAVAGRSARDSAACPTAAVHYGQPAGADTIGFSGATPPWVGSKNLVGFLFFYGSAPFTHPRGAEIATGGRVAGGETKILWWVRQGTSRNRVVVSGQRLDRSGRFRAAFAVGGPSTFPSVVNVPDAGCWRISVTPGSRPGQPAGSVVFRAVSVR